MNGADRADDVGHQHVLEQVPARPCVQRAANIGVALIRRECDRASIRELLRDPAYRLDTIEHRHTEVHEHHIGPVLLVQRDGLLAILGLRRNEEVVLSKDDGCQPDADGGVVVSDQDAHATLARWWVLVLGQCRIEEWFKKTARTLVEPFPIRGDFMPTPSLH